LHRANDPTIIVTYRNALECVV